MKKKGKEKITTTSKHLLLPKIYHQGPKNNLVRRSIVLYFTIIFMISAFTPIINADENIDQQQTQYSLNFAMYSTNWGGQRFIPSMNPLSSVDLYMRKIGNPPSDIAFSVRSSLSGSDLVSLIKPASEIPSSYDWVKFDFSDLTVTPGSQYFLVLRTSGGSSSNCYNWGYGFLTPYTNGIRVFSTNGGSSWTNNPSYDTCFKTYSGTPVNGSPVFGSPSPGNGSTGQPLNLIWSIPISDPDGDVFSWTIQCSNGQSNSATGASDGTKSLALSGLANSTTYKVWVNATDPFGSGNYTRRSYTFTTQQQSGNELLDQQQTQYSLNFAMYSTNWGGQRFIPSMNPLSSVDLYMRKIGSPPSDVTFSVRSSLSGSDLVSLIKPASEIPTGYDWVKFDFSDLTVTPGSQYYLVLRTSGGTSSNCYNWGYGFLTPYTNGIRVFSTNGGSSWTNNPSYDTCFKTYTYGGGPDIYPPTPDPSTWVTVPYATGQSSISMTATTAIDPSTPVQYYFDETSGNTGGTDSGWQSSSSYTDTGLNAGTTYTYRVQTRDAIPNTGGWSSSLSATPGDAEPPTPNPSTWVTVPYATGQSSISMTATTAIDPSTPVQYYFDETSGNTGGTDSGWQSSSSYTDTGLNAGTTYTYRVQTRDAIPNTGGWSSSLSATIPPGGDIDPPTPNPSTWNWVPYFLSSTSISMMATIATDPSGGVQYYFEETSGHAGGTDSGWQSSSSYTDTGLTTGTTYTYRVQTRDALGNTGLWSPSQSATTHTPDSTAPVLKWTYAANGETTVGPLAVDVNSDGILEIFVLNENKVTCLNGATGAVRWIYTDDSISNRSQAEIGDLNNDGIPEIVLSAMGRTIALHANDGTIYWRVLVESQNKNIVIADLDGNHYPYVFTCSADANATEGWNANGRIRKLRGTTGQVLAEIFSWRPCYGSLSFADANNDGRFELYMSDRASSMSFPSNIWGKGMQCYDAETLQLLWYEDDVTCSSHYMALIDVNKDGVLDAVAMQESGPGSVWVIDGKTGERMPGKWQWTGDTLDAHSMIPVYDIDGDGNLELISCSFSPLYIWDIGRWANDTWLGEINGNLNTTGFGEPPKFADVMGDQRLEIIATSSRTPQVRIYSGQYDLLASWSLSGSALSSSLVQDVDNDGKNELLLVSRTGTLRVYDTSAYTPTPEARGSILFYSERRMGTGIYVPPPGAPQPIIKEVTPANQSTYVKRNPTLSTRVIDFHYDPMNIAISTNASGSWTVVMSWNNVGNGVYSFTPTNMNSKNTRYYWRVTASDPSADNMITQQTYWFITASDTPDISNINPSNQAISIPVGLTQLRFKLNDSNGNLMTYTVQTSPNIGTLSGNVHNITISVPVSGLSYFTTYHWYINVTDGTNWNRQVFTFMTKPQSLIADSNFNNCASSSDLRTNGPGQDWYESYNDNPALLTLDQSSIGGNTGKKAKLTGDGTHTVYMSQELTQDQSNNFSIQFDVYVDEIINTSDNIDKGAYIFIGDDSDENHGPCSSDQDRYVMLAFRKNGGGTNGSMELIALDRYDTGNSNNNLTRINRSLYVDTWYTIRIDINFALQRYNVYINNVWMRTIKSRMAKETLTHISFANLFNSYGTFFIDNVISS